MRRYIAPLQEEHEQLFGDFYVSREDEYDYFKKYLIQHSLADQKRGDAKTYLYIQQEEDGSQMLLGFYSLRASSLIIENDDFSRSGEPAIEIYEFAVKKSVQKTGIGSCLIKDAFTRIFELSRQVGVKHILVCAKKDAVPYYQRYKFRRLLGHKDIPRSKANAECVAMSVPLLLKD